MKKIIVFGATGTVGRLIVEQGLLDGHQVTAFCRNTSALSSIQDRNLQLLTGDVYDQASVNDAVKGHDTVIIALGSGKSRKSTVRSVGTQNIITAMESQGIKRLICQTTLGAGDSHSNLNFFWKYIMFGWFLKQVFNDHELQESYVRKSNLDWTLIRPGAFTDGPLTGQYRHGFATDDRSVKLKISRADIANFIISQVRSSRYLFQSPGLSY